MDWLFCNFILPASSRNPLWCFFNGVCNTEWLYKYAFHDHRFVACTAFSWIICAFTCLSSPQSGKDCGRIYKISECVDYETLSSFLSRMDCPAETAYAFWNQGICLFSSFGCHSPLQNRCV